jgi:hypothetical protein
MVRNFKSVNKENNPKAQNSKQKQARETRETHERFFIHRLHGFTKIIRCFFLLSYLLNFHLFPLFLASSLPVLSSSFIIHHSIKGCPQNTQKTQRYCFILERYGLVVFGVWV